MSSEKDNGKIELIYGCMFSGKTTKLIERYNELKDEFRCKCINYIFDKRYTNENKIVSHDKKEMECDCYQDLGDFINENGNNIYSYDYIFINEAQFFENLEQLVLFMCHVLKINVVLCGLDLDYKREKFGELMNLKSRASELNHMKGKCDKCENESLFTHRLVDNDNQVLIGSSEYIPVCEECWNKLNNNP